MIAWPSRSSRRVGMVFKISGRSCPISVGRNSFNRWEQFLSGEALLGAVTEPLQINLIPAMMFFQASAGSSPVGSPSTLRRMLEFAARHHIAPVNEHFPMSRVNDAFEHLRSGKARYLIVLDRD